MQVFETKASARDFVWQQRCHGRSVGLVPTMGALHAGHLRLVDAARRQCDVVAATIFVNPTQFGPAEDFDRYPRTLDADLEALRSAGANAVFVPTSEAMYGERFACHIDPPAVAQPLEGRFRPEHFRGVVTIVAKLFNILPATHAFFGQKDFQQVRVIESMVQELDFGIEVHVVPTVREADGLALSSRNRYLSAPQRRAALGLSRALHRAQQEHAAGQRDRVRLEATLRRVLEDDGVASIDYAAVADPQTLAQPDRVAEDAVALIAAHVGLTRLIDNHPLDQPFPSCS